jgi:hypothetical protein
MPFGLPRNTQSPFPSTVPAAPQVRRIGMHVGEGVPAPAAEEQPWPRSPAGCVGVATSSLARERPRRPATLHLEAPAEEEAW